MELAKKKAAKVKKGISRNAGTKEKTIPANNIIGNVEKWSIHQKIDIVESGISKSQLEEVKKQTGLDYEVLSNILAVTKATLHNKKGNEKFNANVSERILLLADIYAYGIEVFGTKERFNSWLISNILALGGKKPIERLNTTLGMQEVKQILGRIDYGVYS